MPHSDSAKPVMRNVHFNRSLKNVYAAVGFAGLSATLFYLLHNRRRKHIYANFYEEYDPEPHFQRMVDGGYLQSCPPPPPPEEDDKKKKKK